MEKFGIVLLVLLLAGCTVGKEGMVLNNAIVEARTAQVAAKAEAAGAIAKACATTQADPVVCQGDVGCVMAVVMANAMASQQQGACVQVVAGHAAEVAVEVPSMIKSGVADVAESLLGGGNWLDNNTSLIAGAWLGSKAFDFGKRAIDGMATAGRPNIDNSSTTTTTTSGDTVGGNLGDTTTVGGNLGDTVNVGDGSQIGDRGDDNSGNTGRIGSPGDNNNQVDNSDNAFAGCTVIPIVSLPGSFTVRCDPTP